jgi:3',5'-cyclic AMP phosphodiesterase CpdA
MLTLLHVSDLHFGPPYVPRVGQALLDIVPSLHADAIVVSGDLTQRAKPQQFLDARAFLDRMSDVPRIVIPGNHDVPLYRVAERLLNPLGLFRKLICDEPDQVLRLKDAVIVGLDSTAPRRAITNGRLHSGQLDFCTTAFAEAPDHAVRIIVAHHHFVPAPDAMHDRTMQRSERAIERFVELGVDMILGGHLHRAYIGNSLDFYPGSHRERGIIVVQCGTTTSRRGRGREKEKNSFNLIQIHADRFEITHYMYFDDLHGFGPTSLHTFPRRQSCLSARQH